MLDCIARIIEPLLRLLWPAAGRHRGPRLIHGVEVAK